MKKFILALCVITAACSVPKSVISDPYEKEWFPGDTVVAANICKSEEVILKVVLADTKSEKATLSKIGELSAIEDCISILPPLPFFVHSIVVSYKDFKNRPSVVFALYLVGDKDKNIIGYAIGAGRPGAI